MRSWTEPGPFHFEGKHYDFRYVNVWPRPYQQPHPPIWIPGSGSMETIRWVAERRYPWIALPYSQFEVMKEHGLAMKNMELLAREVMPSLRAEFP